MSLIKIYTGVATSSIVDDSGVDRASWVSTYSNGWLSLNLPDTDLYFLVTPTGRPPIPVSINSYIDTNTVSMNPNVITATTLSDDAVNDIWTATKANYIQGTIALANTALSTAVWTNTIAGYIQGTVALSNTALSNAIWTDSKAGYIQATLAPANTALSNLTWTDTKAGYLQATNAPANTALSNLTWTNTLAGYIQGTVALSNTALSNLTWTDTKANYINATLSGLDNRLISIASQIYAIQSVELYNINSGVGTIISYVDNNSLIATQLSSIVVDVNEIKGDGWVNESLVNISNTISDFEGILTDIDLDISELKAASNSVSQNALSITKQTGNESGTVADTYLVNSNYYTITPATNEIDFEVDFNIGRNGLPISVSLTGFFSRTGGSSSPITVESYNWQTDLFETRYTWNSTIGTTTDETITINVFAGDVGQVADGDDDGKVRLRFSGTGLSNGESVNINQIFINYTIDSSVFSYDDGAIWIDTNKGTNGDTPFINGISSNPCKTYVNAESLEDKLKIKRFRIINGSIIDINSAAEDIEYHTFIGDNWKLQLGSTELDATDVSDASITGARITGYAKTTTVEGVYRQMFCRECILDDVHNITGIYNDCILAGDVTLGTGNVYFIRCTSGKHSASTPNLTFNSSADNHTYTNIRDFNGGLTLMNMNQYDTLKIELTGRLIIHSSCTGGVIHRRGLHSLADENGNPYSGPVTIIEGNGMTIKTATTGYVMLDPSYDAAKTAVSSEVWTSDKAGFLDARITGIMDEMVENHLSNGSFGKAINDINTSTNKLTFNASNAVISELNSNQYSLIGNIASITSNMNFNGTYILAQSIVDSSTTNILNAIATQTNQMRFTGSNIQAVLTDGGVGLNPVNITLVDSNGSPLYAVEVWVTLDNNNSDTGTIVAGKLLTNASGQVTFMLDAGIYWIHYFKEGVYNYHTERFTVT